MVVVGDDDLELGVVVDVADADVQPVAAEAAVALAVAVGVVARPREVVVARPGRRVAARGLVERAVGVEHEHLGAPLGSVQGLGGGRHHLDPAVAVEVRGGQAADLRNAAERSWCPRANPA